MRTSLFHSVLFLGLAGGCMGSGHFAVNGEVTAPDLVVISPGVQVIANYDEPIFYSENYYWRNDGGAWYRSQYHTGGWARVEVVPVTIRSIERPSAYVHYHGEVRASEHVEHREAQPQRPEVRDHRVAPAPRHEERRRDDGEHGEGNAQHRGEHGDDHKD
jgi:hypothetical protein